VKDGNQNESLITNYFVISNHSPTPSQDLGHVAKTVFERNLCLEILSLLNVEKLGI